MSETDNNLFQATDMIVQCGNPIVLDGILHSFGTAVIQDDLDKPTYMQREGGYVVRCFSDAVFIKFVIEHQGYGRVIKILDKLI
jgi:hypothetical protein